MFHNHAPSLRATAVRRILPPVMLIGIVLTLSVSGCDCDTGLALEHGDGGVEPTCCVLADGTEVCTPPPSCFSPLDCERLSPPTTESECRFVAPLLPGPLAEHLDMAVSDDGTQTFLSGYAKAIRTTSYGDLVFGVVGQGGEVSWSVVDGVPDDAPAVIGGIAADVSGWRGGIVEPGDDVGRDNAIAVDPSTGRIGISYFDATHGALKFAQSTDGGATWVTMFVDTEATSAGGEVGRYTSLAYLNGAPVIAYLARRFEDVHRGQPSSRISVAFASSPDPAGSSDWTVGPAFEGQEWLSMECAANDCTGGTACVSGATAGSPSACEPVSDSPAEDCATDAQGAVDGVCPDSTLCTAWRSGWHCLTPAPPAVDDYPNATGLFTSLVARPDGLALSWYSRIDRALYASVYYASSDSWSRRLLVHSPGQDTAGDAGLHADMTIGPDGNLYLAYVEAYSESLWVSRVDVGIFDGGGGEITRERVDDGWRDFSDPSEDAHLVGANADIAVTEGGAIRVAYQDQSSHYALLATRAAEGEPWTLQGDGMDPPLDSVDSTGYWTAQAAAGGEVTRVATWWRNVAEQSGGTRVFELP